VLSMSEWEALAERLRARQVKFLIEPHIRFRGEVGEQATMFLRDPSGNALEFKAFADMGKLFATSLRGAGPGTRQARRASITCRACRRPSGTARECRPASTLPPGVPC
jgi:hypothetical protein